MVALWRRRPLPATLTRPRYTVAGGHRPGPGPGTWTRIPRTTSSAHTRTRAMADAAAGAGAGGASGTSDKTRKPPPYGKMVLAAIRALKDHDGSSRQGISKYMKSTWGADNKTFLAKALKKGVKDGVLEQRGTSRFAVKGESYDAPDSGLKVEDLTTGDGDEAKVGCTCTVKYKGKLAGTGEKFDAADKFTFTLGAGEVIKGWDQGVQGMRVGGKRRLTIPPQLGYGKRGSPPEIPGGATLVMDVTLRKVTS